MVAYTKTEPGPGDFQRCLDELRPRSGMMHVALASDEAYFPGLACAVLSILANTGAGGGISFHILDGGIEEASWRSLEKKLSSFSGEVRLRRYRLSLVEFDELPVDHGNALMTYARLLMPSLIREDEVIYVDADILCLRDLRDLWEEPLEDNLVAACQDFNIKFLANDSLSELAGKEAERWYFNAGFMKVNLKLWRKEDVQGRALRLVRGGKCTWLDQTALNSCLKGRVKYLDRGWNRFSFEVFSLPDFSEERTNIHYVSEIKPWMYYNNKNISYVIWRLFRAKWMPNIGRPKGRLERIKGNCYGVILRVLNQWGGAGIPFSALLWLLSWNPRLQGASRWLEKQRTKIAILKYVGSRF